MNADQLAATSFGTLAYPYPGRSAKTISGCGLPGHRTSKKLIDRVRPGVELVFAIFVPSSELMTLDFPTFDRPRNAISGNAAAGNWFTAVAAHRNRERTRTAQFRVSARKLQVGGTGTTRELAPELIPGREGAYSLHPCRRPGSTCCGETT